MSCSIGGMDTELRTALVIEAETISRHCDLVRGLKSKFKHTIQCLERPGDGTCATYALNLLEAYRPLVKELQDFGIRPGSEFMRWLVDGDRLTEMPAIREDALVCYFREGAWQHVGIAIAGGRVGSKWGTYAVFEHRLSEVPANYGDDIRFFVRPSARASAGLLFEFACAEMDLNQIEADRLRAATGIGELF
jgi:hypothetical protein